MPPVLRPAIRIFSVLFAFTFSADLTSAQLLQSSLKLSSEQQTQIHDLAARVLKHADSSGCKKSCTILVANFTGETGSTSAIGIQLADEVSAQLGVQTNGIQIASRRNFQQYLERERIASKLLEDDNAARWLAMDNGASAVLIGYLRVGLTQASLHVQLLDTRDFGKRDIRGKTYVEEETFKDVSNFGALESAEPFGEPQPLNAPKDTFDYSKRSVGEQATTPHCTYRPDPSYSNAARTVKFQGTLILRVIISKDGDVPSLQVLRGLPFGLNKQALESVSKWRCEPATVDGQPVSAMVPIEVSFRLY
ncbi:MAG TPA: energy transducer TonB [Candidatus Dormibacteraeota bacterium]|jgi:TonB family protein|nr:energy transducer TonB [Candidatus Dormibacteraeota bacterium]